MEYTAFNHAAWNSLHSIGIHCTTMHGVHCVQLKSIAPHCLESTAISRDPLGHAASNPLHSIGIHLATLHGILFVQSGCILPCCIESTAFSDAAWNHCIQSGYFGRRCIKSTSSNRDALGLTAWNLLHSIMLHGIHCIQSCCIKSPAIDRTTVV